MWLEMQRQAHTKLRSEVYRPLPAAEARGILQSRRLGVASLRLLPKMSGGMHLLPSPVQPSIGSRGLCC